MRLSPITGYVRVVAGQVLVDHDDHVQVLFGDPCE